MKILFLAKEKPFARNAAALIKSHVQDPKIIFGESSEPFPEHVLLRQYDYVISYISPWIVPEQVLRNTGKAAINFHTGPPEYPGVGCTNFALYYGEQDFGITVHHMNKKVDSGDIISVERFQIFEKDTVFSLTQRCYAYIYIAFIKILPCLLGKKPLPSSTETWQRKPYTRKQLNALCKVTSAMTDDEIIRRVKAVTYPGMPGAFLEAGGIRFLADTGDRNRT
jgi:methionyl-tRNA formyltransferase